MLCESTPFAGLFLLTPTVHRDERGFFLESYRQDSLRNCGIQTVFIQDNHARSEQAGVLRGLHFQAPPHAQAKLVWVSRGAALDVVVDIRTGSSTYGRHFSCLLSAENFQRLYIPHGFAHGYMTLEPGTEFQYKVDALYNQASEGGLLWNDPSLGIAWPTCPDAQIILSEKDTTFPLFTSFVSPFQSK